jgi:hypothetical protein
MGTSAVADRPTVTTSPLVLSSTAKKRITVKINLNAITSTNGSSGYSYDVKYSTNNTVWVSVDPPSNGFSPGGAAKYLPVTRSGVTYYFKIWITTNAGTLVTARQSVISR